MKINYYLNSVLLILFISLLPRCFIIADDSFIDNRGKQIYFEYIGKNVSTDAAKAVLFLSFQDNYKNIPPYDLKNTFKHPSDVIKWLQETFRQEINNFKSNSKTHLIVAKTKKDDTIIGVIIFELPTNNSHYKIIHVRQLAILPEYQQRGIGTKLLFFIKDFIPDLDLITVDVRKANMKANQFYKRNGFSLVNAPHDRELDPNKYYGFVLKLSD